MSHILNENLLRLHTMLYSRFHKYNLNLQAVIGCESAAGLARNGTQVITYVRPCNEAQNVEAMMGRDLPGRRLDWRRHPVIELRATATGLVLEFIIPPDAWWDQQNLVGKLRVERHRQMFRRLIAQLSDDYRLGFWQGTEFDAMYLTPAEAAHPAVFEQWVTTFSHGQDWFRVGVWYDNLPASLNELEEDLFQRARILYDLYTFIAWTGNNDYRSFYQRNLCYA